MRPPRLFNTSLSLRGPLPVCFRGCARNAMSALLAMCALTLGTWLSLAVALNDLAHAATPSVSASCDRLGTTIIWQAAATTEVGDSGALTGVLQQHISGTWVTQDQGVDSIAPFTIDGRGRTTLLGPHRVVAQFTNISSGTIHTDIEYCN